VANIHISLELWMLLKASLQKIKFFKYLVSLPPGNSPPKVPEKDNIKLLDRQ